MLHPTSMLNGNRYFHPSAKRSNPLALAHDPPISLPESPYPAPSLAFPLPYPLLPVLHPYNSFLPSFCLVFYLYCAHKLLQTLQIASNFAAYFCIFKLMSSITSSLADDDYKIVIESFQHNYCRFSFVFIIVVNNLNWYTLCTIHMLNGR